jgi:hypothetical protein
VTHYSGGGGSFGAHYRETGVITASTVQVVIAQDPGDGGLGADRHATFTYTVSGSTLTLTPTCGINGGAIVQSFTFSAPSGGPAILSTVVNGDTLLELTKQ